MCETQVLLAPLIGHIADIADIYVHSCAIKKHCLGRAYGNSSCSHFQVTILEDADERDVLLGLSIDETMLNRLAGTEVLVTLPRPKPILDHIESRTLAALCRQKGAHKLAARLVQSSVGSF